jgi:glutamine amidotransferase
MKIAIIDYDLGNLFSVKNAINSVGLEAIITYDREEIMSCDAAILPGVGAFNIAMTNILKFDLDKTIIDFIAMKKPFIGICLGFQLLFTKSYEFIETQGLGIIDGEVLRIPESKNGRKIHVPNVGWLSIYNNKGGFTNEELYGINENEYMYFVHSYYVKPSNNINTIAYSKYENFEFCCAVKKDNVFGVQFHPEKSGKKGIQIYRNIKNIIEKEYRNK